jgi:hypothetical protein
MSGYRLHVPFPSSSSSLTRVRNIGASSYKNVLDPRDNTRSIDRKSQPTAANLIHNGIQRRSDRSSAKHPISRISMAWLQVKNTASLSMPQVERSAVCQIARVQVGLFSGPLLDCYFILTCLDDPTNEASSPTAAEPTHPSSPSRTLTIHALRLLPVSMTRMSPRPEPISGTEPDKFRYDRRFLLQLKDVCEMEAEYFSSLEAMGIRAESL